MAYQNICLTTPGVLSYDIYIAVDTSSVINSRYYQFFISQKIKYNLIADFLMIIDCGHFLQRRFSHCAVLLKVVYNNGNEILVPHVDNIQFHNYGNNIFFYHACRYYHTFSFRGPFFELKILYHQI
jgi:hypothetical protein